MRTVFAVALTSIVAPPTLSCRRHDLTPNFAGWDRPLSLWPTIIFYDIDRDMFLTVVNRERMFNELRENKWNGETMF